LANKPETARAEEARQERRTKENAAEAVRIKQNVPRSHFAKYSLLFGIRGGHDSLPGAGAPPNLIAPPKGVPIVSLEAFGCKNAWFSWNIRFLILTASALHIYVKKENGPAAVWQESIAKI